MSHPLVLALFRDPSVAAVAARALRLRSVDPADLSVVARNHEAEGELARDMDATPGTEIEDSRAAARLGELGAQVLSAVAFAMPGIGPILAAGPLSAELGEAAGHVAGGLAGVLARAGVPEARAEAWQTRVRLGAVLLGVHVRAGDVAPIELMLREAGADELSTVEWD